MWGRGFNDRFPLPHFFSKDGEKMGLTKEEKAQIREEYNQRYKAYVRRLRHAEKKGYEIPDSMRIPRVKNPTQASIDRIDKIVFKSIKKHISWEGGVIHIDPITGEKTDVRNPLSYEKVIPEYKGGSPWLQRRKHDPRKPDPDRPLSFDEYAKIGKEINRLKTESAKTGKSLTPDLISATTFDLIKNMRGEEFDTENFIRNEEISEGYLAKDPHRPLDQQEINLAKNIMQTEQTPDGNMPSYKDVVDEIRGLYPEFSIVEQSANEMKQEEPAWTQLPVDFDAHSSQIPNQSYHPDFPEQIPATDDEISFTSWAEIAVDNFLEILDNVSFKRQKASNNKDWLESVIQNLIEEAGQDVVGAALRIANEGVEYNELFIVEMMYNSSKLSAFIAKLQLKTYEILGSSLSVEEFLSDSFDIDDDLSGPHFPSSAYGFDIHTPDYYEDEEDDY